MLADRLFFHIFIIVLIYFYNEMIIIDIGEEELFEEYGVIYTMINMHSINYI